MSLQNDDRPDEQPVVTIKLASTSDELMQCFALRSAVYIGEQQCPYWEEFDGNDFTATHLILYVDGEPASSMRLRWFGTLRQVRARRHPEALPLDGPVHSLHRVGDGVRAQEGLPRVYLHSQHRLWPIMERQGFKKVDDKVFNFSDHEYGAYYRDLDVAAGRAHHVHRSAGAEPAGRPARHAGHPRTVGGAWRDQSARRLGRAPDELRGN